MISTWLRHLGLRLQPLFHPRAEEEARNLQALRHAVRDQQKTLDAQGETIKALTAQIGRLEEATRRDAMRVDAALSRSQRDLEQWRDDTLQRQRQSHAAVTDAIRGIRSHFSRKGMFTASVLERARRVPRQQFLEQAVIDRLTRIARSGRPIIAGPWTGEVGFELNYWSPFVRWFVQHFGIDPARLTVVSRGGPESWYHDIGGSYIDVFRYAEPGRFAAATADRLKQKNLTPFDIGLIRQIARDRGLRGAAILHPSLMYTLFRSFFARDGGIRQVFAHTAHRRIEGPGRALFPNLPPDYVAAKFYFRRSFPRTPENTAFIRALLDEISTHRPVVLLDAGIKVDDHEDYGEGRWSDLASLGAPVTVQNNLEIQTAVISSARAFIGTYGGFSYLAPLCGVPALAFYSEPLFYLNHRYMADVVAATLNVPPLTMLPTHASPLQRRAALDLFALSSRHV